jgi:ribosome modulation factor
MPREIGYKKAGRVGKQLHRLPNSTLIAVRKQWLNGWAVNIFVPFVDNVSLC